MRFEGKVVLVTGGAQGIGKEIALRFGKERAKVNIFDVNEEALTQTLEELKIYTQAEGFIIDISSLVEVEKNVNKIIDNFSRVDILVNNAGITKDNLLLRLSENDWDKVLAVNLKGAFNCTKIVAKYMLKQRCGKIINISSIIGIIGNAGQTNYAASKAALIGFTKSLAKELGSRNITVNAVAPGFIQTAMTERLPKEVKDEILRGIALGRFGEVQDVANAVLFLASEEASYISGQVLVVDGGFI